jgi:hypothetical protein
MPRPRTLSVAAAGLLLAACATAWLPPPRDVLVQARQTRSYSARLRVWLRSPDLRARARVLLAFERPDQLRIEVPGPGGLRLLAVTRDGALVAVFPGERAYYAGSASAADLDALLGVPLTPAEVMDVLVGEPPTRVRDYRARWGSVFPREIRTVLPDGGRLRLVVEEPEGDRPIPSQAFLPPSVDGYRRLDAQEARRIWAGR